MQSHERTKNLPGTLETVVFLNYYFRALGIVDNEPMIQNMRKMVILKLPIMSTMLYLNLNQIQTPISI